MKIKSDLRLKAEDLADAVWDFVSAILATTFVEIVGTTILVTLMIIGWFGIIWIGLALFCLPFHGDGAHMWLKHFVMGYPWLAGIWLLIIIGAVMLSVWIKNSVPQQSFPPEKN